MVRIYSAAMVGDCVPPCEYADGVVYDSTQERVNWERRAKRRRLNDTKPPAVPLVRKGRSLMKRSRR